MDDITRIAPLITFAASRRPRSRLAKSIFVLIQRRCRRRRDARSRPSHVKNDFMLSSRKLAYPCANLYNCRSPMAALSRSE